MSRRLSALLLITPVCFHNKYTGSASEMPSILRSKAPPRGGPGTPLSVHLTRSSFPLGPLLGRNHLVTAVMKATKILSVIQTDNIITCHRTSRLRRMIITGLCYPYVDLIVIIITWILKWHLARSPECRVT